MKTSWDLIYSLAKEAGAKFPQVVAAQWALESNWGKHTSGKNNFFGIKGKPGTTVSTQEWDGSKFITIKDTFKDYNTPADCVQDLVNKWYLDYMGYKGVNRAKSVEECAKLLKLEGYATDPRYPEKLIRIMSQNPTTDSVVVSFLEQAAKYYRSEPHQKAAWRILEQSLDPGVLDSFKAAYRASEAPQSKPSVPASKFPLKVPYFYQRDSRTGHSERMCFSSSMAMAMDYLNPNSIQGDDDWYLREVLKRGDTVSSTAQIATARSLGFTGAEFHMDGTESQLIRLLDASIPVPIGILHKGPISSPTGGGHWICLIGYDSNDFFVHDPFGCLDLIRGGYPKAGPVDGKNQRYYRKNLMKRWLIQSKSDGWYVQLKAV